MIQYLGPLVSLFKLFLEGFTQVSKSIRSGQNKSYQRKIIEIQLSLEEIIDNANILLSILDRATSDVESDNRELIMNFKERLFEQRQRISILVDQVTDRTAAELLKLFTPDLRRNILLLTERKISAINHVLLTLYDVEKIKIDGREFIATVNNALQNWDHERFVLEGQSYLAELRRHGRKTKCILSDHIEQQKEIIERLSHCSRKLSEFIKSNISIQDAIGIVTKKST